MNESAQFFSRQQLLSELEFDSLRSSSAMVVGLGNVGGPAALELARAGVGRLVVIDRDDVARENASRGIFRTSDVGMPKAVAAALHIAELVPGVDVEPLIADVRAGVPEPLFSSCDALLIATDSWSSRMHANRWAHALPGRTRIIVTGGIDGLSWELTSSVPNSALGCSQCPHGEAASRRDEEGGCGVGGQRDERRIDPSVSFTGAAVASHMVMEVCAALGGGGPRYAGHVLSFEFGQSRHSVLKIMPDPNCTGHRRLVEHLDYVVVQDRDVMVNTLAGELSSHFGVCSETVSFTADREIVRVRLCLECGLRRELFCPAVEYRAGATRCRCGSARFNYDVGTEIVERERTLAAQGIPLGKALIAHSDGASVIVIRKG